MTSELRTSVVIDLSGNLERRANRYAKSLEGLSTSGRRSMGRLSSTAAATGRMLDRMGNRYTALLTGGAVAGAGKMLVGLETRFVRLGIQANRSAKDMDGLKRQIFETAQAAEIRVDPGEITGAIEAIVEKTGDLQFAQDNIRNIGVAIQATGAAGKDIGEILAEFQKMDIRGPQQVLEVLDMLNKQGKEGAFTLQNLAALGPRVITAYTATGRAGPQALREMGAALQMIRMGTASSDTAAGAWEALLRTLTDPEKIKQLEKLAGISVFDPVKLKEGQKVLRPINELMEEIVRKSGGDRTKIETVFGAEAARAFNQAGGEFLRTGSLGSLEKFIQIQGDGTTTLQDASRAANTAAAALTNLSSAWKEFADGNLTKPIQELADALNSVEPGTVQRWMEVGKWAVAAGAVLYGGRKLYKGGAAIGGFLNGRGGATAALVGAAGSAAGVTPVYVVNLPGAGIPGIAPGTATRIRTPGRWQMLRAAPNLRTIGTMGAGAIALGGTAVAGAGLAGYGTGRLIDNYLLSDQIRETIGGTIATIMARLGSEEAQRALDANMSSGAALNNVGGKISIEVDDKRVRVREVRSDNPNVDYEIESGLTMGMP